MPATPSCSTWSWPGLSWPASGRRCRRHAPCPRVRFQGRLVGRSARSGGSASSTAPSGALDRLAEVLAGSSERREEERLARVLDRIREKIVSELRPRDLAYQILDGLHQLVDYDHSVGLPDLGPGGGRCSASRPRRSSGPRPRAPSSATRSPAAPEQVGALRRGPPPRRRCGARRRTIPCWRRARLPPRRGHPARSASLLCAPLFFGDEFLGLLKIAAWKRRAVRRAATSPWSSASCPPRRCRSATPG